MAHANKDDSDHVFRAEIAVMLWGLAPCLLWIPITRRTWKKAASVI
jgi:hypothetical protein